MKSRKETTRHPLSQDMWFTVTRCGPDAPTVRVGIYFKPVDGKPLRHHLVRNTVPSIRGYVAECLEQMANEFEKGSKRCKSNYRDWAEKDGKDGPCDVMWIAPHLKVVLTKPDHDGKCRIMLYRSNLKLFDVALSAGRGYRETAVRLMGSHLSLAALRFEQALERIRRDGPDEPLPMVLN